MKESLVNWECPSPTQQLGEAHGVRMIQSAKVAKIGEGPVTINMQQSPQIHLHIDGVRDAVKYWLQSLPEPRWKFAKAQLNFLAVEICGGNKSLAAAFLGRARSDVYDTLKAQNILESAGQ